MSLYGPIFMCIPYCRPMQKNVSQLVANSLGRRFTRPAIFLWPFHARDNIKHINAKLNARTGTTIQIAEPKWDLLYDKCTLCALFSFLSFIFLRFYRRLHTRFYIISNCGFSLFQRNDRSTPKCFIRCKSGL